MEDILAAQYEGHGRIARTWENMKKNGQQNITLHLVRNTIALLDAKWNRMEENHALLIRDHRKALKDHEYLTEDFISIAESQYSAQRSNLTQLEQQLTAPAASETAKPGAPAGEAPALDATAHARSYPKIELPKFNGRFEEWPSFRDLFESMVIKETALPNVQKLHYLKTSVSGEAANLLKNLPTTEDNFTRAWDTLKEQFENKRLLVRSYLNGFVSLPKMRSNSMADLKNIYHGMINTVSALEGIGRPVTSTEDLFVHLVVNLLDNATRREWDKTLRKSSEPPSYAELHAFLKEQMTSEEAVDEKPGGGATSKAPHRGGRAAHVAQQRQRTTTAGRACPVCTGTHFIATCADYLARAPQDRKNLVSTHNRCFNCLGRHSVANCTTTKTCQRCSGRHHTSLHDAFLPATTATPGMAPLATVHVARQSSTEDAALILATARGWVTDYQGRDHAVRALIDPGSEINLISESLAQRLRLPRTPTCVAVFGVNGRPSGVARGRVTLTLASRDRSQALTVSALVLPRVTVYNGPPITGSGKWPHIQGLSLADPDFLARDPVELLLGARAYGVILLSGVRKGAPQDPVAQQTSLGWILLGGEDEEGPESTRTTLFCSHEDDISATLRRFWEWEEPSSGALPATAEEEQCERFFCDTLIRLPDGRFQVRLPFRTPPAAELAHTKQAAVRMLDAMERRFARDRDFQGRYTEFMEEYMRLRHMSPIHRTAPTDPGRQCYLPHHGVVKAVGGNTKLRVVFNGSARTPSGISLNDTLLAGRNLLPLLPEVLLRWRRHQYAFVADIEKMYRQISLHPEDRSYQRILWRHNGNITDFELNTVTYGTACAPYLAIRVLHQLVQEDGNRYPAGAAALQRDCYVDDILSGASSVRECQRLQKELTALCMAGGFPLRKWAANHPDILRGVPASHRQCATQTADLPLVEHSVLGLRWQPSDDHLTVTVTDLSPAVASKRSILSQVAKLFDPLGWLAPVVVVAKLLIQTAWLQQLDWDAPLAAPEATQWTTLVNDLPVVEDVRIPRWFAGLTEGSTIEVHGFSDASERACGAVIYLRIIQGETVNVSFVQAKTKVAPLKRVSLPRLELCGAALLAKLSCHVREALGLMNAPTYHWTDSMVTLCWIRGHPAKWTTFVANRVADIQRRCSQSVRWRHVPGAQNPADCASRGLLPRDLAAHAIWWQGPPFLKEDASAWPTAEGSLQASDVPDQRPLTCLTVTQEAVEPLELTRFSSLQRLLRVTSWMLRWRHRSPRTACKPVPVTACALQPQEIEAALKLWILVSQRVAYSGDLKDIHAGRAVPGSSPLRKLTPFVDGEGVLRVGGRLKHALLDADQKHPIILPPDSHLSRLLVEAHHRRTLHGGTQATLALIRQRFWLPRGRQLVKGVIHRCPNCVRWRAASPQPVMGDLPAARVTPHRPFLHVGVDFAGPIRLRTTRGRGHRSYKAFLCIFVCFSTRAVHLEAVSDYSAIAFLAAFRRFTSRRGLPTAVYSDQGTNFVGADNELRALFAQAAPDAQHITGHLANEGVRWVFNPPAAPHFGGLWEAAVRSTKHHLRRVIGDTTLTYEEMATLLAEVEACLNSRPLQALSDDPDDIAALTPGHFLVGEPLLAIPEPSLLDVPANRLARWRFLQRMRDHLWARWSQEYLQSLIPRPKWWKETGGLKEGQLCLIKDESCSPTRWPLARVVRLHPGADAQIRVVEVKTATGTLTRPVIKLVPLPDASS